MTTHKEEGLKPFFLKVLVNRSLVLGPIDVKTVFEDKEEADEICEALNKAWNHRHATEEQGLREFLEEMEHADFNCDCRSEDEEFPGQKESVCSWHTRIKAALSNAPAPQIICTCREGSSLPEGQHFVGCGLYKFPVPESERHT